MIVHKVFYNVNRHYIKNINTGIEEELIKDEDIKRKRQQYLSFSKVINIELDLTQNNRIDLTQNKAIKKGSGLKTTIKDIEKVTGVSKSTYYTQYSSYINNLIFLFNNF